MSVGPCSGVEKVQCVNGRSHSAGQKDPALLLCRLHPSRRTLTLSNPVQAAVQYPDMCLMHGTIACGGRWNVTGVPGPVRLKVRVTIRIYVVPVPGPEIRDALLGSDELVHQHSAIIVDDAHPDEARRQTGSYVSDMWQETPGAIKATCRQVGRATCARAESSCAVRWLHSKSILQGC